MKTKDFSLLGMILSSTIIFFGGVFLLITNVLSVETATATAIIGISVGLPFAPVSMSIFLDKIGEIKNCNQNKIEHIFD